MKLTEILGPNKSRIYIEYDQAASDELQAVGYFKDVEDIGKRTEKFKETIVNTIQSYSSIVANAVKKGVKRKADDFLAADLVALEFGLQVGGEAGVPFVTKGTAQANVKVTIEWKVNQ